MFLADCETEPRIGAACWPAEDGEVRVPAALWVPENAAVVGCGSKPAGPAKALVAVIADRLAALLLAGNSRRQQRSLRRQSGAALCATLLQNASTGFGCHTRTEAMSAGSLDVAGLERAFHFSAT